MSTVRTTAAGLKCPFKPGTVPSSGDSWYAARREAAASPFQRWLLCFSQKQKGASRMLAHSPHVLFHQPTFIAATGLVDSLRQLCYPKQTSVQGEAVRCEGRTC